jgi:hypothetical protein
MHLDGCIGDGPRNAIIHQQSIALLLQVCERESAAYLVLPPSTFSFSAADACAAASLAVRTRNGEHET